MTTRLPMAVVLLLVLLAQGWGLVSVWRDDPLQSLAAPGKKEGPVRRAILPAGRMSLQPTLPDTLPDLDQGYLFNAERSLAGGGGKDGQSQNGGNVGMDRIHYSGSIITGANPRALLSYALGGQPDAPGGPAGIQKQGFLRVSVGDAVDGYKVTEILPEKIIFSRDGQKITKLLYDKAKDRGQGQTPRSSDEQGGQVTAASPGVPAAKVVEPRPAPTPASPGGSAAKVAQPRRTPFPRKQFQPLPSDEELRKKPLRKRLEPPPT